MKFNTILAVATAALVSFTSTGAFAQSDKEKKQAEVRTKADATLITGDQLRHAVSWNSANWAKLPEGDVMIRIHLRDAEVFALTLE